MCAGAGCEYHSSPYCCGVFYPVSVSDEEGYRGVSDDGIEREAFHFDDLTWKRRRAIEFD